MSRKHNRSRRSNSSGFLLFPSNSLTYCNKFAPSVVKVAWIFSESWAGHGELDAGRQVVSFCGWFLVEQLVYLQIKQSRSQRQRLRLVGDKFRASMSMVFGSRGGRVFDGQGF